MNEYVRDLLENYENPEPVPYTAEELASRIARGDNHHADYMWLLARTEKAEAEIERLREQTLWIPVSEGLPNDFARALASCGADVCEARHSDPHPFYPTCCGWHTPDGFCLRGNITHWRPLPAPAPPEEE